MRTLIASAALATALFAAPQLALAQAGDPANQAPYCMQGPGSRPELLLSDYESMRTEHRAFQPGVPLPREPARCR